LALAVTVSAHCPQSACSDALLQHPAAAASFCKLFEKYSSSLSSNPTGKIGSAGDSCVCTPQPNLPYPDFAASCVADLDFASTISAACDCLASSSGHPSGGESPSSNRAAPHGSPGSLHNGSGSGSSIGSLGKGGSGSGSGRSGSGSSASVTTQSAVTTVM